MQRIAVIRTPPTDERTAIFNDFLKNPTLCIFSSASTFVVDCSVDIGSDFADQEIVIIEVLSVKVVGGIINAAIVLVSELSNNINHSNMTLTFASFSV